uniref:Uncharacterized protein n=2 Tax=Arion vulgaris TaxID=1028688 RepID=A0A0B7BLN7_9EUPU
MSLKCKFTTMQKVTAQLYSYFCREARRGGLYHNLQDPKKRTQHVLGINRMSFCRWIEQDCSDERKEHIKGRKRKTDDFDKDVIVREIHKMFKVNDVVTLRKLKSRLRIQCDIDIS